ncbi:MAG: hypothetical protein RBT75_06715 [Anaerolineae bacterium]|nr:hypothetical protein [Anaerolineae bacterium]
MSQQQTAIFYPIKREMPPVPQLASSHCRQLCSWSARRATLNADAGKGKPEGA